MEQVVARNAEKWKILIKHTCNIYKYFFEIEQDKNLMDNGFRLI